MVGRVGLVGWSRVWLVGWSRVGLVGWGCDDVLFVENDEGPAEL